MPSNSSFLEFDIVTQVAMKVVCWVVTSDDIGYNSNFSLVILQFNRSFGCMLAVFFMFGKFWFMFGVGVKL